MDQQLLAYIEQELKRGVRPETIKKALCDAGWEAGIITEAFLAVQSKNPAPDPQAGTIPSVPSAAAEISKEFNEGDLPEKKKKLSPLKIILGVAALVFAGITVFFYLMEDSGSMDPIDQNLFNEALPPAGGASVQVSEGGEAGLPIAEENEEDIAVIDAESVIEVDDAVEVPSVAEDADQSKDGQRKSDMQKLVEAQKAWFAANEKYYTCNRSGGNCGGSSTGYPAKIGDYLAAAPKDPSGKTAGICGQDFIYCGLNNVPYSNFFCYYAKLESGGYYTASHEGNFLRQTPPKIFEECAMAN